MGREGFMNQKGMDRKREPVPPNAVSAEKTEDPF
jgi:hypothetical protein